MCEEYQPDYISEFHEEFMRAYIDFELAQQEKASTQFLKERLRVIEGRPATQAEFDRHMAALDPFEDEE